MSPTSAWGSGKLILFGEHAVVYGAPAIAVALERGLKVTLTPNDAKTPPITQSMYVKVLNHTDHDTSTGITLGTTEQATLNQALLSAEKWARNRGVVLNHPHELTISGALPFKVGLGSSAALSVATLRALALSSNAHPWTNEELFEGAMEMEKVFHVKPSGLDHQVSITGGALCYQRQDDVPHFTPIDVQTPLTLALVWVPRRGSTADAVQGVALRYQQNPHEYSRLFSEIAEVSRAGRKALERGFLNELGSLLDHNHQLLSVLGVSTPELNHLSNLLKKRGALGAKLSGAGHGGVCFGLFPNRRVAEEATSDLGSQVWVVDLFE